MELSERYIQMLEKEEFLHVYEWQGAAGVIRPEHSHKAAVTMYVTDGQITFDLAGHKKTIYAGQRLDIPIGTLHSMTIGPAGAIYIVGEMDEEDSQ